MNKKIAERRATIALSHWASGTSHCDAIEEIDPATTREDWEFAARISPQLIGLLTALIQDGDLRP